MEPEQSLPPSRAVANRVTRQLVSAGSLRLIVGFDESRSYVDLVGQLTRVPRSPAWLLGVFGLEGVAIPLVDLDAWAHRSQPAPWTVPTDLAEGLYTGKAQSATRLRALVFAQASQTWAIRVSQAPAMVDLQLDAARQITLDLPLAISSMHGRLMSFAGLAWPVDKVLTALQPNWNALAQAIRLELSSNADIEEKS